MKRKICVLTGATGGIGQAIAQALAARDWQLLLIGRDEVKLHRLQMALPGQHDVLVADLGSSEAAEKIMAAARLLGGASMLINNAGVNKMQSLEQSSEAEIAATLLLNLQMPMLLCRAFLPQLREKSGTIVNIGSSFGSIGYPYQSLYCASKFGLRGFSEALARELADSDVSVRYLAPRATDTEINSAEVREMNRELGNRMDSPEVVAEALCKLIEGRDRRLFIGFPEKLFARLNGLLPELVDNAIAKQLPKIKQFLTH